MKTKDEKVHVPQKRILEDYRAHKLLAAFHEGSHKGRVWGIDGQLLTELQGSGLDELMESLRTYVDSTFAEKANGRQSPPDVAEYVCAFRRLIKDGLTEAHRAMLRAHYRVDNRTITATQLAQAGKYKSCTSATMQYGMLGKRLYEQVPTQLPSNADGTLIYRFALATEGEGSAEESQRQWTLRPEVAQAIKQVNLH